MNQTKVYVDCFYYGFWIDKSELHKYNLTEDQIIKNNNLNTLGLRQEFKSENKSKRNLNHLYTKNSPLYYGNQSNGSNGSNNSNHEDKCEVSSNKSDVLQFKKIKSSINNLICPTINRKLLNNNIITSVIKMIY